MQDEIHLFLFLFIFWSAGLLTCVFLRALFFDHIIEDKPNAKTKTD
jgi:hypothetical protein